MNSSRVFNGALQKSQTSYSTSDTRLSILIAVCTLGKNQNLKELIRQLIILKNLSDHEIRIIIIWNSEKEIDQYKSSEIEIYKQPKIGYATSRNEALKKRKPYENLLFIDDDEILEIEANERNIAKRKFIDVYLEAAGQYPESIFVGPYYPVDSKGLRKLIPWKKLPEKEYGDAIEFASGGNLFLPSSIMNTYDIVFDNFFDFGGEDTKFASDCLNLGIITRWIPEAFLYEITPEHRYSQLWQDERNLKNFLINVIIDIQNRELNELNFLRKLIEALKILILISLKGRHSFATLLTFSTRMVIFKSVILGDALTLKKIAISGGSRA